MNKRGFSGAVLVTALSLAIAACSHGGSPDKVIAGLDTPNQYQARFLAFSSNGTHAGIWRLDTNTGALDFCELEAFAGKSIQCTSEAPAQQPAISEGDINSLTGSPPKIGEVREGYRFKGGDPDKKESWELASNPPHPWK